MIICILLSDDTAFAFLRILQKNLVDARFYILYNILFFTRYIVFPYILYSVILRL